MTIQFNCEICGKSLSTSDDKAGRKAKCPGCGEMLVVPQLEGAATEDELMPLADDEEEGLPATPRRKAGGKVACPMCGEKVSATATKCKFCGEPLEPVRHELGAEIELSEVFSTAWETFTANLGYCVGGNLIASILTLIGYIPLAVVAVMIVIEIDQRKQEPSPGLLMLLVPGFLIAAMTACFFTIGVTRLFLKLARDEEAEFTTVFSGGPYFFPAFLLTTVFAVSAMFGFILLILPGLMLVVRLWPYWYLAAEARASRWQCLTRAWKLTGPSWTVSLFLCVIVIGVQMALGVISIVPCIGPILQLVGSVFVSPFVHMVMVTAYVQMSHGEVPE
ncbi:MAG TPA: zinc ribbon domain-containing protein [Planctomycetaceae bacterium]|nr:zinc ribbon domain-containing protein [Planctomycetaceae bacterium]